MPEPRKVSRFLADAELLKQCRIDHHRSGGPGGQKRNKTTNAVRLVHESTGIIATATESRSLSENHLQCLRRMRIKLSAEIREPIELLHFDVPDWFLEMRHAQRLEVSHRHPFYAAVGGLILDLLVHSGNPATVAANLGVSTTTVIKILEAETAWWTTANGIRRTRGMTPLTARH